jgi:hypothetical protein
MKCFKKVFIVIILISFIGLVFACTLTIKSRTVKLYSQDYYLKIYNKKIVLLNNKEKEIARYNLKEIIKDFSLGDIDGDSLEELILLTKKKFRKYGNKVIIFSLKDGIKEIYQEDFSRLKPWKLALGDIDGDGKDEVSIGVYKKTRFHQLMAKRPFLYSYENNSLQPKWRGSRLSKPFIDYNFYDIDGDGIDEIVSIEILEDSKKVINTYKWEGFGFEGFLESNGFKDIKDLKVKDGSLYVKFKEKRGVYLGKVKVKDDNLIIERVNIR